MLSAAAAQVCDRPGRAAERAERLLPRLRRRGRALGRAAARRGRGGRDRRAGAARRSRTRRWPARSARRGGCARSSRGGPPSLGACALVAVAAAAPAAARPRTPRRPREFTVTFLDVGQGDATLVQAPGGIAALVDGGPPEADVASKLRARGVDALDLVVLTHAQEDHQGGLEEVLGALPGRRPARRRPPVATGPTTGASSRSPALAAVRVVPAAAGQRFRLGVRCGSTCWLPDRRSTPPHGVDPNLRAAVLHVSYRGLDVLLPADAESEVTAALAAAAGRGAEGRPPRQRRRGPGGAARAAAPGGGGDPGRRRTTATGIRTRRPCAALRAAGAAGLPHRPRRRRDAHPRAGAARRSALSGDPEL